MPGYACGGSQIVGDGVIELPGYTIVRALGRGGMATVYLAEQHSLRRQVALKVLSPSLSADRHFVERFLREGRVAAGLRHRHIVAVHDVGTHGDLAFVAMEYLPLGAVPRGPLPPPEVLRLLRDIGSALEAAHAAGIVHRDVKPDNILMHEDGAFLLSDFGIAWVRESTSIVTREGVTLGTPEYMSPEQWRNHALDGRSDLYSLGIVMYQLLTGRLPYADGDGWSIGMQHMSAPLPKLPREQAVLQPLLNLLLAKDPPARVPSGAELVRLVDALERSGKVPTEALAAPLATTPMPAFDPTTRQSSKGRWGWWSLAVPAIFALGIGGALLWPPAEPAPSPAASIAVLPFRSASSAVEDVQFAEGLSDELLDALAQIEGVTVAARPSTYALRDEGLDVRALGQRLRVATLLDASVSREGNMLRLTARLADTRTGYTRWSRAFSAPLSDALDLQRDLVTQLARELLGTPDGDGASLRRLAVTQDGDAYASYLRGRRMLDQPGSVETLEATIGLFRAALAADPAFARAQAGICSAEVRQFTRQLDPTLLERARQACASAAALDPGLADLDLARAELAQARGEHTAALDGFERAAGDPALRAAAWLGMVPSLLALGQTERAQARLEDARALQPAWWAVYAETGRFRLLQGDGEGAAEMFRTALDFRPERPLSLWNNLGAAHLASDNLEAAAEAFEASLALGESASALSNLGTVRFHLGDFEEAAGLYRRACAISPKDHRLWGNLGDALAAAPASSAEAGEAFRTALGLAEALLAERPGDLEVLADLAFYHASLGHAGAASALLPDLLAAAPSSAELAFRAALVYARLGDAPAAQRLAGEARRLGYSQRMLATTPLLAGLVDSAITEATEGGDPP